MTAGRCPGYGPISCVRSIPPGVERCRRCQDRADAAAREVEDTATVAEIRALLPAGTRVRLSLPSWPGEPAQVAIPANVLLAILRAGAGDAR